MIMFSLKTIALAAAAFLALNAPGLAQAQTKQEEPFKLYPGLPGRDAVWVPTPDITVEAMLDFAKATKQDYVIDLGSGDGRMVIAAARRGIRGHGVEYNQNLVDISNERAKAAGVADLAKFVQGDMYVADISQATVMPLFLLTANLQKLTPNFLKLRPGTRIVVNTYSMGDWEHDDQTRISGDCMTWCAILLYIVPAQVGGTWRAGDAELKIDQKYQKITGSLGGVPITGRLRGAEISFTAGKTEYTGRVEGNEITGTSTGARSGAWSAKRS